MEYDSARWGRFSLFAVMCHVFARAHQPATNELELVWRYFKRKLDIALQAGTLGSAISMDRLFG